MPIYDPETSVSTPERLPANSLGLTTQNNVLSVSNGAASRVVATATSTRVWSELSATPFTVPNTTSLNLS